jgi:putative addiction module component (TIGR02574 family)
MSVKELEEEIMRLAPKDQAYLFDKLSRALDADDQPLSLEELERRAEDLRSGRVKGVSVDEMLSSAERLL